MPTATSQPAAPPVAASAVMAAAWATVLSLTPGGYGGGCMVEEDRGGGGDVGVDRCGGNGGGMPTMTVLIAMVGTACMLRPKCDESSASESIDVSWLP